jgi:hypothetical protein
MAGILDHQGIFYQSSAISTEDLRNRLLNRNLPGPVNETLTQSGLASKLDDIGRIINVPIFGVSDENIPIHYDEDEKMIPLGTFFRTTQNVNLNRFTPQNDDYRTFELTVPPNLGYPKPEGFGDKEKGEYPISYNPEKFDLITKGDRQAGQFPLNVVDTYKSLNFQKETSLGLIAGQELEKSIISKIAQVEDEANDNTLGVGHITPPIGNDGGVDSYVNRLRGTEQYFNTLPNGAIGWNEYNQSNGQSSGDQKEGVEPTLGTEIRVNTLLDRTSVTQVSFLFDLLDQNKYKPLYEDRRLQGTSSEGTNPNYYIGTEKSTNRGATTPKTFDDSEFNGDIDKSGNGNKTDVNEEFFWKTGGESNFNKKTLLYKTQQLVDNNATDVFINQTKKYFKDKKQDRLISRGNALSPISLIDAEANGNYCRVWTVTDKYNYLKAIRNTGLFSSPDPGQPGFSVTNGDSSLSVLMDSGLPKYHPTIADSKTTLKKYMLSIENLAWADNLADLPLSEIGPGDILSGNKGRIMWFPPYGLSFDENTTANWTPTEFIGRSEPIYTYNNTKRSGQISFKVVVDHPKVINGYRGKSNDVIERFLAGCVTPDDFLSFLDKNSDISQTTQSEIDKKIKEIKNPKTSNTGKQKKTATLKFDKAVTAIPGGSDTSLTPLVTLAVQLVGTEQKLTILSEGFTGKNEGFIKKGSNPEVPDDSEKNLQKQSKTRAKNVYEELLILLKAKGIKSSQIKKSIVGKGSSLSAGNDNDRRVDISIENDSFSEAPKDESLEGLSFYPEFAQLVDNLIIDESSYFDFIDGNYPNYFSTISEKIKYFQPGYHSTTPEGLNSRLTFLNQCMRQGPSINSKGDKIQTQNLSFGRPPICILRIGDFFHTKVVINSLSITYDDGGIKWDLNPEGIGVQPMIANVSLSVDLIGGHSLVGPINRLQNAVSFNYYANTQMYDPRADKIDKSTGEIVPGVKLGKLKQDGLGKDGVDKLTESLKTEGIVKQVLDSENTGDSTDVEPYNGVKIESVPTPPYYTVPLNKILITSSGDTKVIISTQDKNGFKEILNTSKPTEPEVAEYDITSSLTSFAENEATIKTLQKENVDDQITLTSLQSEIQNGLTGGTVTNVSTAITQIKELETNIQNREKEIKELEGESNKVKVVAYLLDNESGSKKTKEFTYGKNGLK